MKILYVQHAGELGGSSMSLLYTMQGMCELGHTCVVALARPSAVLRDLYASSGFEVLDAPGLALWDHSTVAPRPLWDPRSWYMLASVVVRWQRTARLTLRLVDQVKPDMVHLNSMPLVPSAAALTRAKQPFVWHVREPPPDQGARTRIIRRVMRGAPRLIFISEYDRLQWVGPDTGRVIQNFVDLARFRPDLDGTAVRESHGIPQSARVILYLGGVSSVKGFFVLLDALRLLGGRDDRFVCLMAGSDLGPPRSWKGRVAAMVLPLIGSGTERQRARRRIERDGMGSCIRAVAFAPDIASYFAAADVVVFPATKPHFARPVIESIAMGKPAVGSNVGGVKELIDIHPMGRAVPPGEGAALAEAIRLAVDDRPAGAAKMAEARQLFDRQYGVRKIETAYRELL